MKKNNKLFAVLSVFAVLAAVGAFAVFGDNGAYTGRIINFNDVRRAPPADQGMTRGQFAAEFALMVPLPVVQSCDIFVDVPLNSRYNQAVCALAHYNIINSNERGGLSYRPESIISRVEAVQMISRAYNVTYNCPLPQLFSDIGDSNNSFWYSRMINELGAYKVFSADVAIGSTFKPISPLTMESLNKWRIPLRDAVVQNNLRRDDI